MKNGILLLLCMFLSLGRNVLAGPSAIGERLETMKLREPSLSLTDTERQYFNILRDAGTDEDKGAVLVQLIVSLSSRGAGRTNVVAYCNDALHLAISPLGKCTVVDCWATTLKRTSQPDADPKKSRAEIADVYLKGILVTLENTTAKETQEPPAVGKFRYVGASPEEEAAKKMEHEAQIRKRQSVLTDNELLRRRAAFMKLCASLFARNSSGVVECKEIADKYLEKHPEVLKELLHSIESEP